MSSAIEVLKSEKILYIEKIKEIESRFNGVPFDIKESYQKSVKVYQEFIDALGEAIVALEKLEKISFILETRIEDVEENIDCLEQELKTLGKEDEIIETELTAYQDHLEDLKEIEKELEGEQK